VSEASLLLSKAHERCKREPKVLSVLRFKSPAGVASWTYWVDLGPLSKVSWDRFDRGLRRSWRDSITYATIMWFLRWRGVKGGAPLTDMSKICSGCWHQRDVNASSSQQQMQLYLDYTWYIQFAWLAVSAYCHDEGTPYYCFRLARDLKMNWRSDHHFLSHYSSKGSKALHIRSIHLLQPYSTSPPRVFSPLLRSCFNISPHEDETFPSIVSWTSFLDLSSGTIEGLLTHVSFHCTHICHRCSPYSLSYLFVQLSQLICFAVHLICCVVTVQIV